MLPTLRAPTILSKSSSSSSPVRPFEAPPASFLHRKWHVTHSTLPKWSSHRNVTINYAPLPRPPSRANSASSSTTVSALSTIHASTGLPAPAADPAPLPQLSDTVSYQPLTSRKTKRIQGIDTPSAASGPGTYEWRGSGVLTPLTSHWEVLGWGEEGGGWMVTWFQKTVFTPEGLDFYAADMEGGGQELEEALKKELERVGLERLRAEIFEVRRDVQDEDEED